MVGTTISNRYRVDSQIGIGGMGVVYKAHDLKLKRDVALKVIAPHLVQDQKARTRFLREAQALAGLSHSNIVTIYDLVEDSETATVCIVMELMHGKSLKEKLYDPKRPSFYTVGIQVCRALEVAHQHGILHRDIKPENVFVCEDGTLKLMDFGLARLVGAESVSNTMVAGTFYYMAPEQLRGATTDARTDLYSLGVLLYTYLAGIPPFIGDNPGSILHKHLTQPPPPLHVRIPNLPPDMEALVMRLLEKDPVNRFASAQTLRETMERMQVGEKISTPAPDSAIPLVTPKDKAAKSASLPSGEYRPRRNWTGVVVLTLLLVVVGAGIYAWPMIQEKLNHKEQPLTQKDEKPLTPKKKPKKNGTGKKSSSENKKNNSLSSTSREIQDVPGNPSTKGNTGKGNGTEKTPPDSDTSTPLNEHPGTGDDTTPPDSGDKTGTDDTGASGVEGNKGGTQ